MSTDVKSLDFARGCISIQNQLITFRHPAWFITPRSAVRSRLLATNGIKSLGGRHLPPFCYCGDSWRHAFAVARASTARRALVGCVSVTRRCLNTSMTENRHDLSSWFPRPQPWWPLEKVI